MKFMGKGSAALISVLLFSAGGSMAGEFRHHHHRSHYDSSYNWALVGTGINAFYIRGTGLFVSFEPGSLPAAAKKSAIAPKAKIINTSGKSACSFENGVCVIRGAE